MKARNFSAKSGSSFAFSASRWRSAASTLSMLSLSRCSSGSTAALTSPIAPPPLCIEAGRGDQSRAQVSGLWVKTHLRLAHASDEPAFIGLDPRLPNLRLPPAMERHGGGDELRAKRGAAD